MCCSLLHQPIKNTAYRHWLSSGESRALCCEGWGEGGLNLLCALPFNLCSQQNERLSGAAQRPRLRHPADDSAPWRRRRERSRRWRERGSPADEERLRGGEVHSGSESGKWRELSKQRGLSEEHCSCTKSGAVRQTPSAERWVEEAGEQRRRKSDLRSWFHHSGQAGMGALRASLSADQTSHRKSAFGSPAWDWSAENRQSQSFSAGCWKVKPHPRFLATARLNTAQVSAVSSSQHPTQSAPGECLLYKCSHCSAVEHTHGRCQGKEHEMSDFLLNASRVSEKQVK